MKLSTMLMYNGNPRDAADQIAALEQAGTGHRLGGRGLRLRLPDPDGLPRRGHRDASRSARRSSTSTRARPTLLAQTAAGLDNVSGGRAILGLGASGPQVVEGWHGLPYSKPLGRTREAIEIIRAAMRREVLEYDGKSFQLPLPAGRGHRPRQAAEDAHPARAQQRPDLHRGARAQVRRGRGGVRRRLAALPVQPGGRAARSGATPWPPAPAKRSDDLAPLEIVRGRHGRRSARTSRACSTSPARWSPSTSAAWAPAARTSTTTSPASTATRRRPRRSRTSTSTARRRRPRPPYPSSCSSRPTSSGRSPTSRSGSRPSASPA